MTQSQKIVFLTLAAIALSIVTILISPVKTKVATSPAPDPKSQTLCETKAGVWVSEYAECEDLSSEDCSLMGGKFDACASPCRHDPDYPLVYCTQICVPVCQLP